MLNSSDINKTLAVLTVQQGTFNVQFKVSLFCKTKSRSIFFILKCNYRKSDVCYLTETFALSVLYVRWSSCKSTGFHIVAKCCLYDQTSNRGLCDCAQMLPFSNSPSFCTCPTRSNKNLNPILREWGILRILRQIKHKSNVFVHPVDGNSFGISVRSVSQSLSYRLPCRRRGGRGRRETKNRRRRWRGRRR